MQHWRWSETTLEAEMGDTEGEIQIESEADIVKARTMLRQTASDLGFGLTDTTRIVTAVSELARNIYLYADTGSVRWCVRSDTGNSKLELVFEDDGPGISDIDQALEEGYTTSNGMGRGLSGSRKLMDEFEIGSEDGEGTTVTISKYLP